MNDRQADNLTTEQRRARDAVRELSRPRAEAAFREKLKREFMSGTIAGRGDNVLRSRPRQWSRLGWIPLAAAAALAAIIVIGNRMPGPELIGTSGIGQVKIDDHLISADQLDEIGDRLRPGVRLEVGDGAVLDVSYPGTMAYRFASGTIITLPDAPGRWFDRSVACIMDFGETMIRTGPRFPGSKLTVETAEGRTIITSTLVSVVRDSNVTCVCVHEGSARIEIGETDLGFIPPGQRRVIFRDGREPVLIDIAEPHRDHLLEFDGEYDDRF